MFTHGLEHLGGGWKPCVENIGIDDRISAVKGIEAGSDGVEKSSPVKTTGRLEEGEVKVPGDLAPQPFVIPVIPLGEAAQLLDTCLQQFKRHSTGLDLVIERPRSMF